MMDGRGYHYEISDFIRKERRSSKFTIPTKYIYFFVEKKPLDYTVKGQYSGQEVSNNAIDLKTEIEKVREQIQNIE